MEGITQRSNTIRTCRRKGVDLDHTTALLDIRRE
jgi:hypothetical protein